MDDKKEVRLGIGRIYNKMKLNFKFKRVISFVLAFAMAFTSIQFSSIISGNTQTASAAEQTQINGLKVHLGDAQGQTVPVDKDSQGGYILEYLPMGTTFTLDSDEDYDISEVKSSSTKMTVRYKTVNNKRVYTITSIKDYSDFVLTVKMKNPSGGIETYKITMKFEIDAVLEFTRMAITIDNEDPITYNFGETDSNGNYVLQDIEATAQRAKIELYSGNDAMTFKINGSSTKTVNLVGGENVFEITVTNLGISKVYTLVISKKGQAKLKSLKPNKGSLSPVFDPETNEYEVQIPTNQENIAFVPVSVDSSSTIKVKNSIVKSGAKSPDISLDEGNNKIKITVTTVDGESNVYTVNVIRAEAFRSSDLKALKLTSGKMSPTFNKGIYEYTATVENNITSVGVIPTAEDTTAKIEVNGKKVPSGATSQNIGLDEGGNTITIVVTDSKDNTSTYVINVTRKYGKDNVNLSSLKVTDGTLSPVFDPEIYNYSVKVARSIDKVRVIFTAENDKAKIKINGKEYNSGVQSDYINLDIGANLITVEVIAEDKKTTTKYQLSIVRGVVSGYNDWVIQNGEWTFYDASGVQAKNRWIMYDNRWYHLDVNGYMDTGWLYTDNNWYYLESGGAMKTGWYYEKGYWYYLQGDGAMRTGSWGQYDGRWYYFNGDGLMQTGWILYYDKWYYLEENGAMHKGWLYYDKNMYYMNDDGSMRNGWLKENNKWFYLDDHGVMKRGWQKIEGKWYYFDTSGAMKSGTIFLDGKWINLDNV